MPATYYCLLTRTGEAKLAKATALGTPLRITHLAVGDGGGSVPQPEPGQTALKREQRRALINELKVDPVNPNQIIIEQVLPEDTGGWWIREIGAFDADGDMIAVGNCPESYKPLLAEGSGRTQVIRMVLIVSSTDAVTLKIDPSVVLATRQHVTETVAKAVSDHLAQPDPHPQYLTESEAKQRIDAAVLALVAGAPGALDTLKELADALGGDKNFSVTVMNMLAGKLGKTETSADSAKLGGQPPEFYAKASDLAASGSKPGRLVVTFRDTPEPGTLACNGAAVSRTTYAGLFAAIGTKYGAGDGSTTFNLPNIPDGHALLSANGSAVGGLTVGEVISHTHAGTALSTGSEHIHFSSSAQWVTNGGNQAGGAGVANGSQTPAGAHTHTLSISATGAAANKAAGMKLLVCIAYE